MKKAVSRKAVKRLREGMTLVELVVFMSLTFMIMSGLFPMISMARQMDYDGEQKVAAFFYCKSVLEELRTVPFDQLALAKNGFKAQKDGSYVRTVNEVPFHTQGGTKHTRLKAVETTTLLPETTDGIPHYITLIRVEWNSNRGQKKDPAMSEQLSTILYP